MVPPPASATARRLTPSRPATIFLAGDVMTGRGIDQILPSPGSPEIFESWVKRATDYVALAEEVHGKIPVPVSPDYIWGDALATLARERPQGSLVNLETSVTSSGDVWLGKGINYRMHPGNIACIQAAHVDVCALANNHVLDFGRSGLGETLDVLHRSGISTAGAGRNLREASRPARLVLGGGASLLVFAFGTESSGIPAEWAAGPSRPGVHLLDDLSLASADRIASQVHALKRPGDIVVASVHWGSNWGYDIDPEQVSFAHRLVDRGVDLVHGHSSHHVRAVEVYQSRLILYGCGDLINDYEGIPGHEEWRGDLGVMYFATITSHDGALSGLRLVPMQMRRMRLTRPARSDELLLAGILNRVSRPFGARFAWHDAGVIVLE